MDKAISVTEAARNFADIINRIYYTHESTTLLKSGRPVARIVPVAPSTCLARDFAAIHLESIPHLSKTEATDFEEDLVTSKQKLLNAESKWD
ncbi:MAG: type II toxin-antitoxin system Phd/YefM family antitoxin [Candidatus Anammoxibacter sp.]